MKRSRSVVGPAYGAARGSSGAAYYPGDNNLPSHGNLGKAGKNIYYSGSAVNLTEATELQHGRFANFQETRIDEVLPAAQDYTVNVQRFSLNTSTMPIFQPIVQTGQPDPAQLSYTVGANIEWSGSLVPFNNLLSMKKNLPPIPYTLTGQQFFDAGRYINSGYVPGLQIASGFLELPPASPGNSGSAWTVTGWVDQLNITLSQITVYNGFNPGISCSVFERGTGYYFSFDCLGGFVFTLDFTGKRAPNANYVSSSGSVSLGDEPYDTIDAAAAFFGANQGTTVSFGGAPQNGTGNFYAAKQQIDYFEDFHSPSSLQQTGTQGIYNSLNSFRNWTFDYANGPTPGVSGLGYGVTPYNQTDPFTVIPTSNHCFAFLQNLGGEGTMAIMSTRTSIPKAKATLHIQFWYCNSSAVDHPMNFILTVGPYEEDILVTGGFSTAWTYYSTTVPITASNPVISFKTVNAAPSPNTCMCIASLSITTSFFNPPTFPNMMQVGDVATVKLSAFRQLQWVPEDKTAQTPLAPIVSQDFGPNNSSTYYNTYSYSHFLDNVLNPGIKRVFVDPDDTKAFTDPATFDIPSFGYFDFIGVWDSTTTYSNGNIVQYEYVDSSGVRGPGYFYVITSSVPGTPPWVPGGGLTTGWNSANKNFDSFCLQSQLRAATNALQCYKGWDGSHSYVPMEGVQLDGYAYVCRSLGLRQPSTVIDPPLPGQSNEFWFFVGRHQITSWGSTQTYMTNSAVVYNNATYTSLIDNNTISPSQIIDPAVWSKDTTYSVGYGTPVPCFKSVELTTAAPFFSYDPATSLFSLNCDTYGFGGVNADSFWTSSATNYDADNNAYNTTEWPLIGPQPQFSVFPSENTALGFRNNLSYPASIPWNGRTMLSGYKENVSLMCDLQTQNLLGSFSGSFQLANGSSDFDVAYAVDYPYVIYYKFDTSTKTPITTPSTMYPATSNPTQFVADLPLKFSERGLRLLNTAPSYFTYSQSTPSSSWSPVASIVLITDSIPIADQMIASPYVIPQQDNVFTSSQSSNGDIRRILLSFIPPKSGPFQNLGQITYTPSGEFRRADLKESNTFTVIDVKAYWQQAYTGQLVPIYLSTGGIMSFELLFEPKA